MEKLNWGWVLLGGLLTATPAAVVGQESAGEAQAEHRSHMEWQVQDLNRSDLGGLTGPARLRRGVLFPEFVRPYRPGAAEFETTPRSPRVPIITPTTLTTDPRRNNAPGEARQQAVPLPALDDMGNPITRVEIEARMRPGGAMGFLGGVLGGLVGGFLGLLGAIGECGILENCSPREDALAEVWFLSGLTWGAVLGGIGAHELREIDRWEALERIRAERRAAVGGGR